MNLLAAAFARCCAPFVDEPVWEWARRNLVLPASGYAIPGPFHVERSNHAVEPLRALQSDAVRHVTIRKATQTFGTGIADVFIPWVLAEKPGPVLWIMQKDTAAETHAKTRVGQLIVNSPALKHLVPSDRRKFSLDRMILNNGVPFELCGPALGNLQGRSIRYLGLDECWLFKPGIRAEALARVDAYKAAGMSKIFEISQGSVEGDDFDLSCKASELLEWAVPCGSCGEHQVLEIESTDKTGERVFRLKWDEGGANIRYACKFCGHEMRDSAQLKAMFNARGKYLPAPGTKPNATHKGFTWSSLPLKDWADIVARYLAVLEAKRNGNLRPLREFMQKDMAKSWCEMEADESISVDVEVADYDPTPGTPGAKLWPGEKFRFFTVDCQKNLADFWGVIRAWGVDGESRRLWAGRMSTFGEIGDVQKKFGVPSKFVFLDAGFEDSKVYRECVRRIEKNGRGWNALKGSDKIDFVHTLQDGTKVRRPYSEFISCNPAIGLRAHELADMVARLPEFVKALNRSGNLRCRLYLWSNPTINGICAQHIAGRAGAQWLSPAVGLDPQIERAYRKHLGGEVKRTKRNIATGKESEFWKRIGPNHLLDCERMQFVPAMRAGLVRASADVQAKPGEPQPEMETEEAGAD